MNEHTAGAVLLVIGVVAIFAAIVGGGVKIERIEVGNLPSRWRQAILAAFGLVVGLIGLILILPDESSANAAESDNAAMADVNAVDENAAVDANVTEANAATDENATDANAAEENAASDNEATEAQ